MASRVDLRALEEEARELLEPGAYAFVAGGAGDERTAAWNEEAWGHVALRPRILADVAEVATGTTVLGTDVIAPILVAPVGMARLVHDDGEAALRRAAASADVEVLWPAGRNTVLRDVAADRTLTVGEPPPSVNGPEKASGR